MAVSLVTSAGVSFRSAGKVLIYLNLYLQLNLKIPAHTTVLNWTKKQGISQFRKKEDYRFGKWVLIVDESIQFGNKKLLLVLAVPERRCRQRNALTFQDVTPLILKVSESWKSEDIMQEITCQIDLQQVAYCISDSGNNLTKAFKQLKCKHVPDVNHRFSLIVQSVFKNNHLFNEYTKALSLLRGQRSMSKIARIVPPNQRIISRYMNLTPLFEWGTKMLNLLDSHQVTEEEREALSFLESSRAFVFDTYQLLIRLNSIQQILKSKGFNAKSEKKVRSLLADMKSNNSLKIKEKIDEYIDELSGMAKGKTICCSSDIIESCFGKYKEVVKGNKTVGISDLCLCIAAMTGKNSPETARQAMETISIRQIKDWKIENISKTLFAEKIELNKKIDRNYFRKM